VIHIDAHPGEIPEGYPQDLEESVTLKSGEVVFVRPLVRADAAALAAEFAAADEETVYLRFFNPSFDLTDERLRYLTEIDYRRHLALVALTDESDDAEGIAIGRFVERTPTDVEGAIVVKPAYRQRGVALALLERLAEAAARRGYDTMSATYLAQNEGAARLLESCGFHVTADEGDGVVDVSLNLRSESDPPDGR